MLGSVDITSRPLRLAYIVNTNNPKQVYDAIKLSSTLWGGTYFPIIPLVKRVPKSWKRKGLKNLPPKDIVTGYINAFEPDILIQLSEDVPEYIKKLGKKVILKKDIWTGVTKTGFKYIPNYGIGIFELLDNLFETDFKYKLKYPTKVLMPKIPNKYHLFWSSLFGELPKEIDDIVKGDYHNALEVETPDCSKEKIKDFFTAGNTLFTRAITRLHIRSFDDNYRGSKNYVFYMDITKVEDIIDYWNLRAVGKNVIPLPKQFQEETNLKELIIQFLKDNRIHWEHNPSVCDTASFLLSRNSKAEDLKAYCDGINLKVDSDDSSKDGYFSMQNWYPRIWDEWAVNKDHVVPVEIEGVDKKNIDISNLQNLEFTFTPILPNFCNKDTYNGGLRCVNNINYRIYGADCDIAETFPKLSGENYLNTIAGEYVGYKEEWSIGKKGLVRFVYDEFSETKKLVKSEDLFFSWLKDLGWSVKKSNPGILAEQIQKRLGGHLGLLQFPKLLDELEYLNGGSKRGKKKIVGEVTNHVSVIKEKLKKVTNHFDLHQKLVDKNIFKLGLKIQCPICQRYSFLTLDEIKENTICQKCLNSFPAIGTINKKSHWSYKTIGPFSVPKYADGAYSVLLLHNFFDKKNILSGGKTTCMSFEADSGNLKFEADYAGFWKDISFGEVLTGVMFAECKSYNSFEKKDFDKMKNLAQKFPGAVLIFSTMKEKLSKEEVRMLKSITKKGRKRWKKGQPINPVLILTGRELFSNFKIPYCWDEEVKKKYNNIHSFLEICDVTQQIYLGLKSWEVEWHENFMKKVTK